MTTIFYCFFGFFFFLFDRFRANLYGRIGLILRPLISAKKVCASLRNGLNNFLLVFTFVFVFLDFLGFRLYYVKLVVSCCFI